eukprot:gb/GEZN01026648.1/.p1 GENE.gb/GEZN01026648.1/~~gb/GEZN01026648.1/.p1  ORF type:complete len:108 (+),score=2.94 gb/GEZN01026648.1/:143-466(+)
MIPSVMRFESAMRSSNSRSRISAEMIQNEYIRPRPALEPIGTPSIVTPRQMRFSMSGCLALSLPQEQRHRKGPKCLPRIPAAGRDTCPKGEAEDPTVRRSSGLVPWK